MSYYKAEDVKQAATGNWLVLIDSLAPGASEALKKGTKHSACPVHGGSDGFRFFKDVDQTGGGICNSCGSFNNGFSLLMWLNDWDFKVMLEAVGDFMRVPKVEYSKRQASKPLSRPLPVSKNSIKHSPASGESLPAGSASYEDVKSGYADRVSDIAAGSSVSDEDLTAQEKPDAVADVSPENVAPLVPQENRPWLKDLKVKLEKKLQAEQTYKATIPGKINDLWSKSFSLRSPVSEPVRRYLNNRGLVFRSSMQIDEGDVRFIPNLEYHDQDGKKVGEYPAILCAIRDVDGRIVTLHSTYINAKGGKAKVPSARKMMPVPEGMDVKGASIRFGIQPEGVLGVAEGLETALSAYRSCGIPVWSTINATLMESFKVPEGVHTVIIWADKDKSQTGERSANKLAARLRDEGIDAFVLMPQMPIPARAKSVDWNDVLKEQGPAGFPTGLQLREFIASRSTAAIAINS